MKPGQNLTRRAAIFVALGLTMTPAVAMGRGGGGPDRWDQIRRPKPDPKPGTTRADTKGATG